MEENVRCICVAESLCYSPETFTTLFVISQLGFPCGLDGKESVNVPAMQEMRGQALDQEDPVERKWQSTSVFLSGKSLGQRSLAGCGLRGCKRVGHD